MITCVDGGCEDANEQQYVGECHGEMMLGSGNRGL